MGLTTDPDLTGTTGLLTEQLDPRRSYQYCIGCDGIWNPWSMGWTDDGKWLCFVCRQDPEYLRWLNWH